MRKMFLSGALALIGLAAPAASVLAPARRPAGGGGGGSNPCGGDRRPCGNGALPRAHHRQDHAPGPGSLLGNGLRRATAVQSANWAGYDDTFNAVASSWTEPTVNCANSNSGLDGILGLNTLDGLLGGPGAASAFWVGLGGYSSTSVEQLGTGSDCDSRTPSGSEVERLRGRAARRGRSPDGCPGRRGRRSGSRRSAPARTGAR